MVIAWIPTLALYIVTIIIDRNIIPVREIQMAIDVDRARHLALLMVAALMAACSNTPPAEPKAEVAKSSPSPSATAKPTTTSVVQETEAQRLGRVLREVDGKSVYFAYDDFSVAPSQVPAIDAHAGILAKFPKATLVLEGNADERGSPEYNLALGQKRAEAVAKTLRLKGVDLMRVESVSFGKEKPRAACHEEKCWAENRRVDFRYKLNR